MVTVACWLALVTVARAGPPYVTDDPEPTDLGHWEDYLFVLGTSTPATINGQTGLELNYGAAKDLQLSITLPFNYVDAESLQSGRGDIFFGAKYRFVHQADGDWMPDVAFYPQLSLPTATRQFGAQQASLFLPLWMQRDFGTWSIFGGFGYDLNPGHGNQNDWLTGLAITRTLTDRFNLGLEVYHQTALTVGGRASTTLAPGVIYQLSKHFALMASGGPGLENTRVTGQYSFYASVQLLY